jgi:hypothetical protein
MKKFNNWLSVKLNEADDASQGNDSYIPMLQQKIQQMKNFYRDIGTGSATGRYNLLAKEIGEIMEKIEYKFNDLEKLVQHLQSVRDSE